MGELYYPTLDLFTYDRKAPLNSSPEEVIENRQNFIQKLPPDHQFNDEEQNQEYSWGDETTLSPKTLGLEAIQFHPVRLHDVYGLRIDCSIDNLTEPQAIDKALPQLYQEIKSQATIDELTFGKTWLVSGWLAVDEHQTPEESAQKIAKDCYKSLDKLLKESAQEKAKADNQSLEPIAKDCYESPDKLLKESAQEKAKADNQSLEPEDNWKQNLFGQGHFLNGYIFQFGKPIGNTDEQIVILLFPNKLMAKKAASFYKDWMLLFGYYHKISLFYRQSRLIKQSLTNHYQKIDNYAKIINNPNIENPNATKSLDTIRDILNEYSMDLLNLSFQKQTITTNQLNYQSSVQEIKDKAGNESDLSFLDDFSTLVEKKYLIQIDKDIEIMQLGLKLLETNLNAIRSRIELEKSSRDRNFQNIITVVGSGTAIAAYLDFKAEKCQPILKGISVPESLAISSCKNFWVGSIFVPVLFLLMLGGCGLAIRKLIQKFN
jgi:hypothetical protein